MPLEDPKGFDVDLVELEKTANGYLPAAVEALRGPIAVITSHEGLEGPGKFAEVGAMEYAYAAFTDDIGGQQRIGCERIEATAQALREIIALYRKADGQ